MEPFDVTQSQELFQRAKAVIPKGIYGHYGPAVTSTGPAFFAESSGAHFSDIDGNNYIDWMCAYGPMILGYNHPVVDEAANRQMAAGNTVTLAAPVLVELAEALVDLVPVADWALFGKNGADSTSLAVMVARAATGRKYVVKIDDGYHGSAPWMQRAGNPGTIAEDQELVISIPWNDLDRLTQVITEHQGDIACFMSSPYHHPVFVDNVAPAEGYWAGVQAVCNAEGIVLILDDVRTGFRIDLAGSNAAYGFQPDLICFGKALGNGYPIAALVGTEALSTAAGEVFYTGTQFFNAAPMAAALATINELKRIDGPRRMAETGVKLNAGLVGVAASRGHDLRATGVPAMPYYRIVDDGTPKFHFRWIAECVRRGAYLLPYHNNFVSTAHTDDDLNRTFDIADAALIAAESSRQPV